MNYDKLYIEFSKKQGVGIDCEIRIILVLLHFRFDLETTSSV